MTRRTAAAFLATVLLLGGCVAAVASAPGCTVLGGEEGGNTVILMAQAVPGAALVPCVDALPVGWSISEVEVGSGGAQLVFSHDRAGGRALVVDFEDSCEIGDAVRVPTDELGTERFESVLAVRDRFKGQRHYVYDGGCTTYTFTLDGEGWSTQMNDMSTALSFRTRQDVDTLAKAFGARTKGL